MSRGQGGGGDGGGGGAGGGGGGGGGGALGRGKRKGEGFRGLSSKTKNTAGGIGMSLPSRQEPAVFGQEKRGNVDQLS